MVDSVKFAPKDEDEMEDFHTVVRREWQIAYVWRLNRNRRRA